MTAFYLDEDTAIALTDLLRVHGHDVTHTHAAGMDRAPDYRQLLHATNRGWVLVTHNRRDFRLLHGTWLAWTQEWGIDRRHRGILVVDQVPTPLLPIVAQAIVDFVHDTSESLDNTLHEWSRRSGWTIYLP